MCFSFFYRKTKCTIVRRELPVDFLLSSTIDSRVTTKGLKIIDIKKYTFVLLWHRQKEMFYRVGGSTVTPKDCVTRFLRLSLNLYFLTCALHRSKDHEISPTLFGSSGVKNNFGSAKTLSVSTRQYTKIVIRYENEYKFSILTYHARNRISLAVIYRCPYTYKLNSLLRCLNSPAFRLNNHLWNSRFFFFSLYSDQQ